MSDNQRIIAGRYQLGNLIGRGGMADVYQGVDTRLGRVVAIKLLKSDPATGTVRLADVATVSDATRNSRQIAWYNKQPAVLIQITKQGDANVIDTVDRVKALIPELKQWIPAGVDISVVTDRTGTIRASVEDMQWTLLATVVLVMGVVFVFLRRLTPTVAAGVAVPLALGVTLLIHLIFYKGLRVPLPWGILLPYQW